MTSASRESDGTRTKALTGLAVAVVITVGAWFGINRATDRGLARLDAIDRVWAVCDSAYKAARNGADTSRIDSRPLSELIDSGSTSAPRRCGDMRRPIETQATQDSVRRAEAVRKMLPSRDRR